MADNFDDEDPVSNALKTRRIPHGRAAKAGAGKRGGGGKGKSKSAPFNPLKAVGLYEIQIGSSASQERRNDQQQQQQQENLSSLTIHGLSPDEDGLLASFCIGGVNAVAVLAGSRTGLKGIVEGLEQSVGSEGNEDMDGNDHEDGDGTREDGGEGGDDEPDVQCNDDDGEQQQQHQQSGIELEDERINRRARAFEKNSFRNPKFWMRWKADFRNIHVATSEEAVNDSDPQQENSGYLIFTGNDCAKFEGTLTSPLMGWDNVKIKGRKIKSHVGNCSFEWSDFPPPR